MSAPAVVWLVIGLVTFAALVAVVAGLVRQGLSLMRTLRRFRDDVEPLTSEIGAEVERASTRAERMRTTSPLRRR